MVLSKSLSKGRDDFISGLPFPVMHGSASARLSVPSPLPSNW